MEIIEVPISELKESQYNPRIMTKKQAEDLQKSIEGFGMVEPIVVNKHEGRENIIVGGHQRYNICKQMGWTEMPVVYVDLDEQRERELNMRLNKNLGEWDWDMLANFDEEMLKVVGFDDREMEILKQEFSDTTEKELDEDKIETADECPKCGYKW